MTALQRLSRGGALLFDLDGTLVDTAPDLGAAANHVRESLGLAPLPLADYRPVASAGARGLLQRALGITPEHAEFPDHRERLLRYYRAHLADRSQRFDGIDTLLAACARSSVRWGVVTNKPSWLTQPLMAQLGLLDAAACVISADEVARPKPAPDSLLHACSVLGLAPADCAYIGDDKRDIDAGRAAGMATVAAAWGYLGDCEPIARWQADAIAPSPTHLIAMLLPHSEPA